jgi:hypothetical protein
LLFENSIKTEATRKIYLYFLDKFKDFYRLNDYDSIIAIGIVKEEDSEKIPR